MDLVFVGIGFLFCYFIASFIQAYWDNKNISLDTSHTQKLDNFNKYLLSTIKILKNLDHREKYIKILGTLAVHQQKCSNFNCNCIDFNFKGQDSRLLEKLQIGWYQFVLQKAQDYQDKNQSYKNLQLILCFINCERLGMNFKVIREVQKLQSFGLTKKEEFFCYLLEKKIEKKLQFQDKIDNFNQEFNISDAALFQDQFNIFITQLKYSVQFFKQFWTELREQIPDLGLLQGYCYKIQLSLQNCNNQFQRLLSISDQNVQIFLIYSEFIQLVVQDNDQFQKLQSKIQNQFSNLRDKKQGDLGSKKVLENSIIFVLSGNSGDIGEILNINEVFTKRLGYTKKEILGQNINQLIPKQIQQQHDITLNDFILNTQSFSVRQLLITPIDDQGYLVLSNLKSKILPSLTQGLQIISVMNQVYEYTCQPYDYQIQSRQAQMSQNEEDYIYHYILYDPNDYAILGCSQSCYEFLGIHKDLTNQNSTNAIQFSIDLICPELSKSEFKQKLFLSGCKQGYCIKFDSTMIGQQFLQQQSDSSIQIDNENSSANDDIFSNSQQKQKQIEKQAIQKYKQSSFQQSSQQNNDLKPMSELEIQKILKKYVQTEIKVYFVQKDKFGNILIKFYDVNKPYIQQQITEQEQKEHNSNIGNLSIFKQTIMQEQEEQINNQQSSFDAYANSSLRSRINQKNKMQVKKMQSQTSAYNQLQNQKMTYGVTSLINKQQQQQNQNQLYDNDNDDGEELKKYSSQHKKSSKFRQQSTEETLEQKRLRIQRQVTKIQNDLKNQKSSSILIFLLALSFVIFATYFGMSIFFYLQKKSQRQNIYGSVTVINNIYSRLKFMPIITIYNQKLHNVQNGITQNEFQWQDENDYKVYLETLKSMNEQMMDTQFKIMEDQNELSSFYKKTETHDVDLYFYNKDMTYYIDQFQTSDAMILIFSAAQNIGSGNFGDLEEIGSYNGILQDFHFLQQNTLFELRAEAENLGEQTIDIYNDYIQLFNRKNIVVRSFVMVIAACFIVLIPIIWRVERHNQKITIIFSHIKTVDINKFLRNIVRYEKKYLVEQKPSVIAQKIKELELQEYQEQLKHINGQEQIGSNINSDNHQNLYEIKISNNQNINQSLLQNQNQNHSQNLQNSYINQSANVNVRQNLLDSTKQPPKELDDVIHSNQIQAQVQEINEEEQIDEKTENSQSESENENEEKDLEKQRIKESQQSQQQRNRNKNKNKKQSHEIVEQNLEDENYVESKSDKLSAQIKVNKFSLIWKLGIFLCISQGYLIFDFYNSYSYVKDVQYSLDHLKYLCQRPNGIIQLYAFLQRLVDEGQDQFYEGKSMISEYTANIYEIEDSLSDSIVANEFPQSFQQYRDDFNQLQKENLCETDYVIEMNIQASCESILGEILKKGVKSTVLQIIETTRSYQSEYLKKLNNLDKLSPTYDDDLLDLKIEYNFKSSFVQLEQVLDILYPLLNTLMDKYEVCFQDFINKNINLTQIYFILLISYQLISFFLIWIPYWISMRNKLINNKKMVSIIPVSCIIDPKNKDLKNALIEGEIIKNFKL